MSIPSLSRRGLLAGAGALTLLTALPLRPVRADGTRILTAGPADAALVGGGHPETRVWAYDGSVPGPTLRFRQGDRLEVTLRNRLAEPTSIHWHGLRLPVGMDGVPGLSHPAVGPGEEFTYAFDLPDAGTFWYHPHANSSEQVARGLSGALIVEEREPPVVDRELVWVLSDWRLDRDAQILGDFGGMHDISHAGRLGNTVTVNGRIVEEEPVRAGERVRLRLLNAASARIFALGFEGHGPQVVALDGQPVEPHAPADGRVVLAPGQRTDLILDMSGRPGERFRVVDGFYPRETYRLLDLAYAAVAPLRDNPLDAPVRLPANPLPSLDLASAERHAVVFGGGMGMMPGMAGDGPPDRAEMQARMTEMRALLSRGLAWTINGHAMPAHGADGHYHHHEPMLTVPRGRTVRLDLDNRTRWHHPIHLHGQHFQVLGLNGQAPPRTMLRDTLLLGPLERAEIAFAAETPGDWMFHCHVLEHQAGGMMATIRIT